MLIPFFLRNKVPKKDFSKLIRRLSSSSMFSFTSNDKTNPKNFSAKSTLMKGMTAKNLFGAEKVNQDTRKKPRAKLASSRVIQVKGLSQRKMIKQIVK